MDMRTTKYSILLSILVFLWLIGPGESPAIDRETIGKLHLHPVDVEVPETMELPAGFITSPDGKLTCDTCHGIEGLQDLPLDSMDVKAPDFLRGGPYGKLSDFCYRCHRKEGYGKKNVHRMLDKKGEIIKGNCTYCHRRVPDPKAETTGKVPELRLPPEKLCVGCHLNTPHLNAFNHLKKPSKEMMNIMKASEKRFDVILPLDSKGRIMCVTCHNPHERGVLDEKSPAGKQAADADLDEGIVYVESRWNRVFTDDKAERLKELSQQTGAALDIGYMEIRKEVLLRLPAKDGILCLACHDFEK